jgi:hypothetical protein
MSREPLPTGERPTWRAIVAASLVQASAAFTLMALAGAFASYVYLQGQGPDDPGIGFLLWVPPLLIVAGFTSPLTRPLGRFAAIRVQRACDRARLDACLGVAGVTGPFAAVVVPLAGLRSGSLLLAAALVWPAWVLGHAAGCALDLGTPQLPPPAPEREGLA